jgi:mono/diheme cytochrome c family protein
MASKRAKSGRREKRSLARSLAGRSAIAVPAIAALLWLAAPAALAQDTKHNPSENTLSTGFAFSEASGEELYANACQGCHMPDGKGATGAWTYPSLAGDKALDAPGYPLSVVVNGQHGMPPVGIMMSDEQVAAVVNYVRTHFGNHYRDAVTADNVKAVRSADTWGAIIRRQP